MDIKYPEIEVQLTGTDGNTLSLCAKVTMALKRAGHASEVDAFMNEALSDDYDHALRTMQAWVMVV